ncbi:hypothetical protein, partial [Alteromonas sp. LTR]|uniref:hypothetical protein n=1 Tax=Alteromonas sp. LTR TaxID=1538096 RepID=UPI001F244C8A
FKLNGTLAEQDKPAAGIRVRLNGWLYEHENRCKVFYLVNSVYLANYPCYSAAARAVSRSLNATLLA